MPTLHSLPILLFLIIQDGGHTEFRAAFVRPKYACSAGYYESKESTNLQQVTALTYVTDEQLWDGQLLLLGRE